MECLESQMFLSLMTFFIILIIILKSDCAARIDMKYFASSVISEVVKYFAVIFYTSLTNPVN